MKEKFASSKSNYFNSLIFRNEDRKKSLFDDRL